MISPMMMAKSGAKVVAMSSMLYIMVDWLDGQQRLKSGEILYNPDT